MEAAAKVKSIFVYPIKSCRGISVSQQAPLTPTGMLYAYIQSNYYIFFMLIYLFISCMFVALTQMIFFSLLIDLWIKISV